MLFFRHPKPVVDGRPVAEHAVVIGQRQLPALRALGQPVEAIGLALMARDAVANEDPEHRFTTSRRRRIPMTKRVAVIGECMLELKGEAFGAMTLG